MIRAFPSFDYNPSWVLTTSNFQRTVNLANNSAYHYPGRDPVLGIMTKGSKAIGHSLRIIFKLRHPTLVEGTVDRMQ